MSALHLYCNRPKESVIVTLDFIGDFQTLADVERVGDFCHAVDLWRAASLCWG